MAAYPPACLTSGLRHDLGPAGRRWPIPICQHSRCGVISYSRLEHLKFQCSRRMEDGVVHQLPQEAPWHCYLAVRPRTALMWKLNDMESCAGLLWVHSLPAAASVLNLASKISSWAWGIRNSWLLANTELGSSSNQEQSSHLCCFHNHLL